jgi:hypothetical protein
MIGAIDPLALAAKMAVTAAIVVAAAVAAERAGPRFGGLIAALPVSAGPAYVFLALKSDDGFIAAAALAGLYANAATALFLLHMALLSTRMPAAAVYPLGLAMWTCVTLAMRELPATLPVALALNVACYGVAIVATRTMRAAPVGARAAKGWTDLALRALLVATLVGGVVTASDALGPGLTGIAALFPITFTCVGLLIHARLGAAASAAAMAGGPVAMIGFTAGLATVHLAAVPLGRATALVLALAFSLGWAALLLAHARRRAGASPARR